jgi:hypothetical protein
MAFNARTPRPNAFVHSLNELTVCREKARAQQPTFDAATRLVFDGSEETWARLAIVLERKAEERGKATWSMSSIESIAMLEELRAAYRTIERAAPSRYPL